MHALLIHQAYVGPGEAGGTRHYEFGKRLVKAGHRFTVVTSDMSYLTGGRTGQSEENHDGVRVLRASVRASVHQSFVSRVRGFVGFMMGGTRAALASGERADLVMGTSPPLFQALGAWYVAKKWGCPFVLEVRDLWPEFAIDMGVLTNPVLIAAARRAERFLYAHADHVIVNSPAYKTYLIEQGVDASRIAVVPNGVDASMFDPDSDGGDMRASLGLSPDHFVVTYAGALGLANDIPTLLDAAEQLRTMPEARLLIVGDGKERRALEADAEARSLTNVLFAGARPKNEIPDVLAASDVCVASLSDIPMFTTTYPNKVFDYMAAGRPTILAIDGVIRKVVEAGNAGVAVPPGDGAAIAEAVRSLAALPDRGRSLGASGRAYVETHFSRDDQADAFEAELRQALVS